MILEAEFLLLTIVTFFLSLVLSESPSPYCLKCICSAASDCNLNLKCPSNTPYSVQCGAYGITKEYWEAGNAIGYNFETCVNLKSCAERVIINYVRKYSRDCNNDGVINCLDYAAMHIMGTEYCDDPYLFESEYWLAFKQSKCFHNPNEIDFISNESQLKPVRRRLYITRKTTKKPSMIKWPKVFHTLYPIPVKNVTTHTLEVPIVVRNGYPISNNKSTRIIYPTNNFNNISRVFNLTVFPTNNSNREPTRINYPINDFNNISREFNLITASSITSSSITFITNLTTTSSTTSLPLSQPTSMNENHNLVVLTTQKTEPPQTTLGTSSDNLNSFNTDVNNVAVNRPSDLLPPWARQKNESNYVSNECLDCLCEATDTCNLIKKCEFSQGPCGPFQLNYRYWNNAGSINQDFYSCVFEFNCSRNTVKSFMKRYGLDCNKDGSVDCIDYALIHKLGPERCKSKSSSLYTSEYWENFQNCYGFMAR